LKSTSFKNSCAIFAGSDVPKTTGTIPLGDSMESIVIVGKPD